MRSCLAIALACASGFLFSPALAASDMPLFEGPPLPAKAPTAIQLSGYRKADPSLLYHGQLPPVPVPVNEPKQDTFSDEVGMATASDLPATRMPTELPVKAETPARSSGIQISPIPSPETPAPQTLPSAPAPAAREIRREPARRAPALAPPLSEKGETRSRAPQPNLPPVKDDRTHGKGGQDRKPALNGEKPPSPAPPESHRAAAIRPLETVADEPPILPGDHAPHSTGFRIPCISCADLSLPELGQPCLFDEFGLELGGWLEAGFSAASTAPEDRFNGPVTFNDRHAEAQMNQLWLYLERKPNTWADGLDLGGRIDVMYGTDAEFLQARDGLEADWQQSERFYQMALPQFYLDATRAGWTVRMGKFFTILGYESPAAPENFFYSHAYTMQYGEPFTHMGMLVSRRFGQWILNAGFHRGDDQFNDTDGWDALNFLGGVGYVAPGDWASVEYALSSTENGPGVLTYTHSLVNTIQVTEKLRYVLQGDYGEVWNENLRDTAAWWGINQYFLYTINPCWAAAVRAEWFRDRDGARVSGLREGNETPDGLAGSFYEVTAGLNWLPRTNLRIRPEIRWDIFDGRPSTTSQAYDAGNSNHQFTFGCDVIYQF